MADKNLISFRITKENNDFLTEKIEQHKVPRSTILNSLIESVLNSQIKIKRLDGFIEEKRQINYKKEMLKNLKKNNHDRYILNNAIKTVCNMAFMDRCTTGSINMNKIKGVIEDMEVLAESFSDRIKKELKNDICFIKKLENEEFLTETIDKIRYIKNLLEAKKK